MTHREFVEKLVEKQIKLQSLKLQWDVIDKRAKEIQASSQKLMLEIDELLLQAKFISGDFTPDDLIGGK